MLLTRALCIVVEVINDQAVSICRKGDIELKEQVADGAGD